VVFRFRMSALHCQDFQYISCSFCFFQEDFCFSFSIFYRQPMCFFDVLIVKLRDLDKLNSFKDVLCLTPTLIPWNKRGSFSLLHAVSLKSLSGETLFIWDPWTLKHQTSNINLISYSVFLGHIPFQFRHNIPEDNTLLVIINVNNFLFNHMMSVIFKFTSLLSRNHRPTLPQKTNLYHTKKEMKNYEVSIATILVHTETHHIRNLNDKSTHNKTFLK